MSTRDTFDFLLYDWLKVDQLAERERFADQSRARRSQVSSTASKVAREWSAKRSRDASWSTFSQSYSRKSKVSRVLMAV